MPPPPPQQPKRPREAATAGSRSTSDVTADEASRPRTRRSPLPPPASAAGTASVQSGSDADGGNASDGVDSVMDGVALLGLHCATPGSSRPASRVASASPAPASGSGASVGAAAAGLQSAAEAAALSPPALLAATITRSTDLSTRRRIEQAAIEHAQRLADLREAVADARQLLAAQLQNPIRSYGGDDAFWQLLVAEFALHLPFDDTRSGHSLGPAFQRKAEAPDERGRPTRGVPELPGLYSLHALRDALRADESLRFTLHCTLEEWKGVLASTRRRWGRFSNDVRAAPGETLLDFDLRLHRALAQRGDLRAGEIRLLLGALWLRPARFGPSVGAAARGSRCSMRHPGLVRTDPPPQAARRRFPVRRVGELVPAEVPRVGRAG